ncbi:MAG: stage II sporulation protein M [Bacillota bacterium]|nr:stage II sporulation protein M [Bacillota bacterium]
MIKSIKGKYLLTKHIQQNFWLYIICIFCLCTGFVLGVYTVKYMTDFEKSNLLNYLVGFTKSDALNSLDYKMILIQTIKNNIPVILFLWFLGLTLIGIPVILVIDVIKGFTIGFTVTFLTNSMGIKGVWMSLLGILPQNILYIPCIIVASVLAMEFSIMILKDSSKKAWTYNIHYKAASYSMFFIAIAVIMFLGFAFETYVTPNVIKLVAFSAGSAFI